tara:strand:- start:56 stop:166 length:111 start_codon:yes stop_codon:yes gene_type:complete
MNSLSGKKIFQELVGSNQIGEVHALSCIVDGMSDLG